MHHLKLFPWVMMFFSRGVRSTGAQSHVPLVLTGLIATCWLFRVGTLNGLLYKELMSSHSSYVFWQTVLVCFGGWIGGAPYPVERQAFAAGIGRREEIPCLRGLDCSVREVQIHTVACTCWNPPASPTTGNTLSLRAALSLCTALQGSTNPTVAS